MGYSLTTEKSWAATIDDFWETFRKWNVSSWSVEPSNLGRRASNKNQSPAERTVVLRYRKGDRDVMLTMGDQDRAVDNLRVLYLAVEALRLNDLRGLSATVGEAYRQLQLPGPGATSAPAAAPAAGDPYTTLYLRPDAPIEVAEAAYRALAKQAHPDSGGSVEQMAQLNMAIAAIRAGR